jgi:hypothetical protein
VSRVHVPTFPQVASGWAASTPQGWREIQEETRATERLHRWARTFSVKREEASEDKVFEEKAANRSVAIRALHTWWRAADGETEKVRTHT